ncbi:MULTISPECIES: TetR/AcrR family transcriptional regulator [Pseudomonas]|uniref:TetR family transcriptional regulator n=1 Tax=Pseudomonas cedrina TaxID=651740 RepID=A0A2S9D3J7_PSECE|nr:MULTISPECIES: TetR/AcrR family transcriptional regulator [Pseudomonas]AVJ24086.1 TetR family transcriptional regulator [Pseudomonas sp. MYb193]PRB87676.1 TetR family transcriptional regulator [Pseudomonas cedrina]
MARPREFDEKQALLAAMHVFWNKGYARTSLNDLLRVTGLSKSSLYETFGDKRKLFMAAYEVYRQERMQMLRGYLSSQPTAYASIETFFETVLEHAKNDDKPFGCMSCNEAVEFGPHDPELQELIQLDFQGMEAAFAYAVRDGRQDSSIASTLTDQALSSLLTVNHQGLQIMARSRMDPNRLQMAVAAMLTVLK